MGKTRACRCLAVWHSWTVSALLPDAFAGTCTAHSERVVGSPIFSTLIHAFRYATHFLSSPDPTTLPTGLGYDNKIIATQWIRSTCPDAEQLDPFYVAQGHVVDSATEVHRRPPQAVTEGRYPAVQTYRADKLRADRTDAATELLILAHDDPDAEEIIKAHEQ